MAQKSNSNSFRDFILFDIKYELQSQPNIPSVYQRNEHKRKYTNSGKLSILVCFYRYYVLTGDFRQLSENTCHVMIKGKMTYELEACEFAHFAKVCC